MSAPTPPRRGWPHLRWHLAALLLLLSVLNYVDRQALSILATTIQTELKLTNTEYARVGQAFLACYTLAYLLAGRIVDRVGPRLAEALFVTWWSVANMLTALAGGFWSLLLFRSLLGLGEPGHYAVAAKAVGQWFPPREKGLAVGLYMMGGIFGAALAAPLVAVFAIAYGWRTAFVVTGAAGVVLALVWWLVYRAPGTHPWLGDREREHLRATGVLDPAKVAAHPLPLRDILRRRAIWVILLTRLLTDPVWYFYLFWFAKYLQEIRGYTLADVGLRLWVVFVAADVGCLLAGWAAGRRMRRGASPVGARVGVMALAAVGLSCSFAMPLVPGTVWPLVLASLFGLCVMTFMASCVALPLDLFPTGSLGSVQGVIGMGGSVGGIVSTGLVAWAITNHSYDAVFVAMSALHPCAVVFLYLALRNIPTEKSNLP